jgi:hypothetical protein
MHIGPAQLSEREGVVPCHCEFLTVVASLPAQMGRGLYLTNVHSAKAKHQTCWNGQPLWMGWVTLMDE